MGNGRDDITSKQLVTFVISSQIGIGILTMPAKLAKEVGHDGWISVILSGLICSLIILIMMLLLKRYKDKSIIKINKLLYGKYFGNALNILIIVYLFFTASYLLRSLTNVIQQLVLHETPGIVTAFFVMAPTIYLCCFGLKYICRYSIIIYSVLASTIFILFLVSNNMKISFLMPVGSANFTSILNSLNVSVISLIGFELVLIIYPNISDKTTALKKVEKANFITCFFYVLVLLATTSLFGENFLERLIYPLFSLSRTYKSPVFERLDLFYIVLWFPAMAGSTRLYLYFTNLAFKEFFNLSQKKLYIFAIIGMAAVFSRIPKNFIDVERYGDYLSNMALLFLVFIIFSYLFSFINKRGTE